MTEAPTGPWDDPERYDPNARALYFDGQGGDPIPVRVTRDRAGLTLRPMDGPPFAVGVGDLHPLPDQPEGAPRLYALPNGGRLLPQGRTAEARLRDASGPTAAPRVGAWRRAGVIVAVASASLAALIFVVLPLLAQGLAAAMGPDAEVALGDLHFEQTRVLFGGGEALRVCDDPAGLTAMDALVERVAGDVALPYDLSVVVLDDSENPTLNAYAVAGGRIAFFDTMIQAAGSPDEIAAVLAHELGHVVARDPVRGLLQGASVAVVLGVLIGDLTGGGLLGAGGAAALTAGYSRAAEARADLFARERLIEAGLPPSALARMFERLRDAHGEVGGVLSHLASHPDIAGRIAAADAQADGADDTRPALSTAEWVALRGICGR